MDDQIRYCGKKTRSGGTCRNRLKPGQLVCRMHGGAAPQTRAAQARRVFEGLVGPALAQYRRIIEDPKTPTNVRLQACRDLFDRTGYKQPTEVRFVPDAWIEAEIEELEAELEQ